jgi:hypothetical protein
LISFKRKEDLPNETTRKKRDEEEIGFTGVEKRSRTFALRLCPGEKSKM